MKILNFGSCNIDYVYSVPHFVKPGETLSSADRALFPGGKGLNQSIAIARNGIPVYHAGCIGNDGLFLKELLQSAGVYTDYLKITDVPCGHAIIQLNQEGENSIILYNGANYLIDKQYIDYVLKDFCQGDIIVLQNEISNIDYIIDIAFKKQMKVILNPSPLDENIKIIDLNKIYLIMLNEVEALGFCGDNNPEGIFRYFNNKYKELKVVLTLGAKGSIYFDSEKEIFCPSFSVEIKDTTCAGDTYTGYFVSAINNGYSVEDSLKLASAAAAIAVSRKGAAVSIPHIAEVKEALKSLKPNACNDLEIEKKKDIILSYVENNLENPCLELLAAALGYSKAYTTVWIKKYMDTSFSFLIKSKRCEKAAELLRTTDMSVDAVISRAGYENGSFFRRIFKELYGKSPLEYRRFYRKKEGES